MPTQTESPWDVSSEESDGFPISGTEQASTSTNMNDPRSESWHTAPSTASQSGGSLSSFKTSADASDMNSKEMQSVSPPTESHSSAVEFFNTQIYTAQVQTPTSELPPVISAQLVTEGLRKRPPQHTHLDSDLELEPVALGSGSQGSPLPPAQTVGPLVRKKAVSW